MKKEIITIALVTAALGFASTGYAGEKMRAKETMTSVKYNCEEAMKSGTITSADLKKMGCDDAKKTAEKERVQENIAPMKK